MPVDTAPSESDMQVFRLDDEAGSGEVVSRRGAGSGSAAGTDEHAPQTDPLLSAETATQRSDRIPTLTSATTDTLAGDDGVVEAWRRPPTSTSEAAHVPQTDPMADGSSAARRKAPSEPGPALNRIGEGSVFRPPKRRTAAEDSDTDEMHVARPKTSSALRPVFDDVDEPGMNPLLLVLTALALVGGAALLVWFMP